QTPHLVDELQAPLEDEIAIRSRFSERHPPRHRDLLRGRCGLVLALERARQAYCARSWAGRRKSCWTDDSSGGWVPRLEAPRWHGARRRPAPCAGRHGPGTSGGSARFSIRAWTTRAMYGSTCRGRTTPPSSVTLFSTSTTDRMSSTPRRRS